MTSDVRTQMGKKVRKARAVMEAGRFVLPSPAEIDEAKTQSGGWTAMTILKRGLDKSLKRVDGHLGKRPNEARSIRRAA